ncbi:KpsF/GutQ family sugar-phosphate isomerase [Roseisolibacter sp. H3M3-2]|nr:KpsF/GutQ family sugar-phosphate isomerase [Roseisolibacter sp. H3M3-2]MDF1502016.1 KpsF/GutQ family sugar-phosphate isomerase [Roseisolibacter sp. H3M3-2]
MSDAALAAAPDTRAELTPDEIVERGRRVLRMERDALAEVESRLDAAFARAVALVRASSGRVIVTGVGKSGLIGRKIAATLTSTGTPATFLHPVESVHGDLGIVGPADVVILLSKSGETAELLLLLEALERFGVHTIAITSNVHSSLARHADVALDAWVREEACPHDLAPTTSTTAALALGDALAVALLEANGFRREDFARLHPGGSLGRRLLTRVADVMETHDLPVLPPDETIRRAVVALAERRGIVVVAEEGRVTGVFTAGDLTRLMEREGDPFAARLGDVMVRAPKTAAAEELGSAVVYRMERHGIMAMPVVDGAQALVGVVHLHDLMRAGAA